jgi:hypothetical protein
VQTTTLQLPCVTLLQPHQNLPVEHKLPQERKNINKHNLQQLHRNATKRTNKFTPQANSSVDRALPYFLQQISPIFVKYFS